MWAGQQHCDLMSHSADTHTEAPIDTEAPSISKEAPYLAICAFNGSLRICRAGQGCKGEATSLACSRTDHAHGNKSNNQDAM